MRRYRACFPLVFPAKWLTRFWARVAKPDDGGCWSWVGNHTQAGYGIVPYYEPEGPPSGFSFLVHRVTRHLLVGPCPDDLILRHRCNNRGCCNPAHLVTGTHADNYADAVAIGTAHNIGDWARGRRGTDHPAADFDASARTRAIAMVYGEDRLPMYRVAKLIGCHRTTISRWCSEHEASRSQ